MRRRRIHRYGLIQFQRNPISFISFIPFISHFDHRHLVLGQRTCFVCTNTGYGPHRFRCLQFAYQVVRLQHPSHVQCQSQRDSHRQALGHRHHDERHRHHEVTQHDFEHSQIVGGVKPQRVSQEVMAQKNDEAGGRYDCAHLTDELSQTAQL